MHRYSVFISGVNRQLLMFLWEHSYIFNISTGKFEHEVEFPFLHVLGVYYNSFSKQQMNVFYQIDHTLIKKDCDIKYNILNQVLKLLFHEMGSKCLKFFLSQSMKP